MRPALRHLWLFALAPVVGCAETGPDWPATPGPKVIASFPPIYCFAANVAGPDAAVRPAMTSHGPHHFDPKPADARRVSGATLFLVNGLGLDDRLAKKMIAGSGNRGVQLVDLGARLDPKELEEGACTHDHEHAEPGHKHEHAPDPHVWLGLDLAAKQVDAVRAALGEADPAHAADYDRRAAEYTAKLKALHAEGVARLKDKTERKFVTFHESLAYFARSLKLEVADVIQKVPGKEPSAKELEALIGACKADKVRVIAVEPQYATGGSAARLVDELTRAGVPDVVLVEIDPLETAVEADLNPGWYEAKMRANIDALAKALK
ncbi:MAG: metal ABC transporter substrate-binding protein [Gemmataceae bacterium]